MIKQFQAVSRLSNATHIHNIMYIKWMWSNICKEVRGPDSMKYMHMISRERGHSKGQGVGVKGRLELSRKFICFGTATLWVRGFWRRRFVNSIALTLPPILISQDWDVFYVSNKYIFTDITIIQPAFSRGSFSQSQQDSALQPFCSMDSHSVLGKAPRLSIRRVVWILASDICTT